MSNERERDEGQIREARWIGRRLKERREQLELRQEDVARMAGIARATYGHYESGRTEIGATDLARVARILRVPVGYFFREGAADDTGIFPLDVKARQLGGDAYDFLARLVREMEQDRLRVHYPQGDEGDQPD